jgi:hypothetical protein
VSQMCHGFWKDSAPSTPFRSVPSPRLNLSAAIRQPIYQQTHGYGTVRHSHFEKVNDSLISVISSFFLVKTPPPAWTTTFQPTYSPTASITRWWGQSALVD